MSELLIRLFVPNYERAEDPGVRAACGKLAGITGIVCNLLLCAVKLLAGILSGSISVTADAVNNLSDAASSTATIIGFRLAGKPADEDHPYGHARIEYLTGLAVAALILVIGYELAKSSVEKLLFPSPTAFSTLTLGILAGSILVKLWMAFFYGKLGRHLGSAALNAGAADSRCDVLSTTAVLVSALIARFTGFDPDGIAGLLVALFILYSGIRIARETMDPLLGTAPDPELVQRIRDRILHCDQVLGIHDLILHDYGPGRRFASVHVELDRNLDVMVGHDILDTIEQDFLTEEGIQLVVHYDPIVTDNEEVSAAGELVRSIVTGLDPELTIHDFRMVPGASRTNLIFDLAVPFRLAGQSEALKRQIGDAVRAAKPNYRTVISVDSGAMQNL